MIAVAAAGGRIAVAGAVAVVATAAGPQLLGYSCWGE
jgi:hypothetical protein